MSLDAWLDNLNVPQRKAVTAPLGNALILAGAGSGKTRVLVSRIAWLVRHHNISPHAILAVTFTNKAAGEMRERLTEMLESPAQGLWVGTFHGLCHRLLRRHFQEANLPEQFHILDSDDQLRMIKRVISALNLDTEQWPAKQAQAFINNKKDEGLRAAHVHVMSYGPGRTLLQIYSAYEQACQTAGAIDFAEILLRTHEMLRQNEALLAHYQKRFNMILVDEFQDTNTIQYAWIRLLSGGGASVMAVGDDDQSIYGWRGAKVENIERFSRDFKNTQTIRLEQNYRSTATILNAANALIANNKNRMGKELWTAGSEGEKIALYKAFNELEEARFISDEITKALKQGKPADEMAILYRSNAQSRVLEEALLRAGTPYRIHGGVRYFERAEVKDTLAYLRLLSNTGDDTAFERIINLPTRGIGGKTLDEMRSIARANDTSLWEAMTQCIESKHFTARAANALCNFRDLISELKGSVANLNLEEQVKIVINESGLHAHFSKNKDDKGMARIENLQELVSAARQFRFDYDGMDDEEMPVLLSFLGHAALESGDTQASEEESSVNLMTLHAAKGLEFSRVFVVGMEDGLFPSRRSIEEPSRLEEERRLCYVGMTRAKEQLVLTYAEVRRQYGREEYHRPSRFLAEIPGEHLQAVRGSVRSHSHAPATSFNSQHESGFTLGQAVSHVKFGPGIVLDIEGTGAHARIQVNFAQSGTKWLVIAYANLSSVESV